MSGRLSGLSGGKPGRKLPRVYVHVGEPKTGTTFLQDVLWTNRPVLAARGIVLPGYSRRDHSRASRDLRQAPRDPSDIADPWTGEWDVLAGQALRVPVAAVISDEVLSACTPQQADRAVRSLAAAEVHVIVTVRDLSATLPAEWQETVKCGGTLGWQPWLRTVVETGAMPGRRSRTLFWAMHDTLATIALWSRYVPAHHIHVVTTPRQRSPQLLWARFAAAIGVDPGDIDLSQARPNSSLRYAEAELLRRINEALPAELPDWFYTRNIKRILSHGALGADSVTRRPNLPPDIRHWARQQSAVLVAGLRESGCHLVGELAELLPVQDAEETVPIVSRPAEMVDAAVASAAALAGELYQNMYPARLPRQSLGGPRRTLSQLEWRLLNGRLVQRGLRRASHLRAVRRLRVGIWRVLMHPGRGHIPAPVRQPEVIGAGRASNAA